MDNKKLVLILSFIGALAGVTAILSYTQSKDKRALDHDIAFLEKQIKQLDLQDKIDHKKDLNNNG